MGKIIEIKNLTKSYGKSRGITELNLDVEEGDIFGFIGSNGAGKSTTIRTILGLIHADGGSASIFGRDYKAARLENLSEIGYMPSEVMFYPGMTVGEVIAYAARLRRVDCRDEAEKLCQRLQLDKNKKVEELSFGNKKKVAIVCAMQHKPKLYIFDEPTSGLDPLMQKEFFTILQERHKEGATIFLSSHVLSEIQHYCTKAAIIRDGKVIVTDFVENLSKTNVRRVQIKGIGQLDNLDGMTDVSTGNGEITFLYHGKMADLIARLGKESITDLTIMEPELEEVFMHFYKEGDKS